MGFAHFISKLTTVLSPAFPKVLSRTKQSNAPQSLVHRCGHRIGNDNNCHHRNIMSCCTLGVLWKNLNEDLQTSCFVRLFHYLIKFMKTALFIGCEFLAWGLWLWRAEWILVCDHFFSQFLFSCMPKGLCTMQSKGNS